MNSFIIIVLWLAFAGVNGSDDSEEILCQFENTTNRSLTYYCKDYVKYFGDFYANCLHDSASIEAKDVIQLTVGGCDPDRVIDEVNRQTFLSKLDISYSGYKSLNWLSFDRNQLQLINASHNWLTESKFHANLAFLNHSLELIELDLSHNKIGAIFWFNVTTKSPLKRIHLQNNVIAFIQTKAFVNLLELKYVDLSNNKLTQITVDAFANLKHLGDLHFENNPIERFDCDNLLAMRTMFVYISWHQMEYFQSNCDKSTKFLVEFTNELGIFPINQRIYKIHCDSRGFQKIAVFKAGANQFESVLDILHCFRGDTLIELDVSGNSIGALSPTTFQRFINLQELSLRETELSTFDFALLERQSQLTAIDFSDNHLSDFINFTLSWNLKNLQQFRAAGNQFHSDLIARLPSTIKYLDLSGNPMGQLTPKLFGHLVYLEELQLRNTKLGIPNVDPFKTLDNLYHLDISENNFDALDFSILAQTLTKLRSFRAAGCRIPMATDVVPYFGNNLWTLDLSHNFMGDLTADSPLQHLNLLSLYLNNANVSVLDANALKRSTNLACFEIADNLLNEIDLTFLSADLLELNLQGNNLSAINDLTPEYFPRLRLLNVAQNQLSCESLQQIQSIWTNNRTIELRLWDQKLHENCTTIGADVGVTIDGTSA